MDAWKKDLENVIDKWAKNCPPPTFVTSNGFVDRQGNGSTFYSPSTGPMRRRSSKQRISNRKRNKNDETWITHDNDALPSKFKLIPPVLKRPGQTYTSYSCQTCEKLGKWNASYTAPTGPCYLFNVLDIGSYNKRRLFMNKLAPQLSFVLSRDSHSYPAISLKTITSSEQIVKATKGEATDEIDLQSINTKRSTLFGEISSNISNAFLRLAGWLLLKIFRQMFSNITCQSEDLKILEQATRRNIPIVYLPLHKSHMDYIIMSFVLFCNNIRVPYTAAGDNLNASSLLGFMLNRLGAFFIRRKCEKTNADNDHYNRVLLEYIENLLMEKQSLQVFIEGTRSRTGKALPPKIGILSIITNAIIKGVVDDVLIVPVNICYEKIPECSTYCKELLGAKKYPETTWQLVTSLYRMLNSFNGQIHIGFGKPQSFQAFCDKEEGFPYNECNVALSKNSVSSCFSFDETTMRITRNLAEHVIIDCCHSAVITCTGMVSFLLATKHRSGVFVDELEVSFDWLKDEIISRNGYLGFIGSTHDVVKYAVKILLDERCICIVEENDALNSKSLYVKPSKDIANFLGLAFYSNQILPLFFGEAIMASALVGVMGGSDLVRVGQSSVDNLSRIEILSLAKRLSTILIREYCLCPPCRNIDVILSDLLETFVIKGIVTANTRKSADEIKVKKYANELTNWDDDFYNAEDEVEIDIQYEINDDKESREILNYLMSIISPLLEVYWLVSASIKDLIDDNNVQENDLIQSLHKLALGRVTKGVTKYAETANMVSLKSAVSTLKSMKILVEVNSQENQRRTLRMSSSYNSQQDLDMLINDINICR